jgi:hypothetical protein
MIKVEDKRIPCSLEFSKMPVGQAFIYCGSLMIKMDSHVREDGFKFQCPAFCVPDGYVNNCVGSRLTDFQLVDLNIQILPQSS